MKKMIRTPDRLARDEYDLLIVGAGIYGICAAWHAALRGLSVALIDRSDFCSETSANPLKIVHGGFRYLQHANFARIRKSSHERKVLMQIAPHLVDPIAFLIPTYGYGMQGKAILRLGLFAYNLIVFDRNRGVKDRQKHISGGEVLSREEVARQFPQLDPNGLTGGVAFVDGQMYSPPRLAYAYLRSAVDAGAVAVNYVEATGFLRAGQRVTGVHAQDVLSGNSFDIRARVVMNTSGPWIPQLLRQLDIRLKKPLAYTKDLYLVVDRVLSDKYALAIPGMEKDPGAIVSRGARHFFVIPWRGRSLIGSSHEIYTGSPDAFKITEKDVSALLDAVNAACPPLALTRDDIVTMNSGLVPAGDYYSDTSRIIDHSGDHGVDGLITITGVRWTTSRGVAGNAVDLAMTKMGKPHGAESGFPPSLYGGEIGNFDAFVREAGRQCPASMDEPAVRNLLRHHGSEYHDVLNYVDEDPARVATLGDSPVLQAAVIHAVREEMAQKLGDIVFRRTDLGTAGHPGEAALTMCARLMAGELGWDQARIDRELDEVRTGFP